MSAPTFVGEAGPELVTLDADDVVPAAEFRTITVPFELRSTDDADGLTLSGYAAVFNSPTRISDYNGDFIEQIAPGAFKHTIRNSRPVMQFDHGQHPLIGSIPVASISKLREDAHGLYVEARVFDNWLTEPLRDAVAAQAIDGMSFRFSVVKDTWERKGKDQVRLYELGPVVFPAYSDTSVALRSLDRARTLLSPTDSSNEPGLTSSDEPVVADDPAPSQSTRTQTQRMVLAQGVRPRFLKEDT
jgi:HK97 family phage prohead protease